MTTSAIEARAQTNRMSRGVRRIFGAALILAASPVAAAASHDDEITLFAMVMASTRTASEEYPGMTMNQDRLEVLRGFLHVSDADYASFASKAHALAEDVKEARARAASREAWCDDVYALLGPRGTLV